MNVPPIPRVTRLAGLLAAGGLALGGTTAPAVAQFGFDSLEPADGAKLVSMDLLTADGSIAPGATEHLGVRLRIQPGWHVYWSNPGDSGTSPRVRIDAPEGITVGDIQWPRPVVFDEAGDVTYGYAKEVTLLVPVTADANLAPGTLTLPVRADWLVCKQACLMGDAAGSVDLRVRSGEDNRLRRRNDALAEARKRLPTPLADVESVRAVVEPGEDARTATLVITGPVDLAGRRDPKISFIPGLVPGVGLGEGHPIEATIKDRGFRIEVPIRLEPDNSLGRKPVATGLVIFGPRAEDRSISIGLPLATG